MLFHVTAHHTEDNCPGYNLELIPEVMKGLESREAIAKQYNVKLQGFWSGAPDHVFYMLLDANSLFDIDQFVTQATPFKQSYRVTPVVPADELIRIAKAMMAQARA